MKKAEGCKGCKTLLSTKWFYRDEEKTTPYFWFATFKGSEDFSILRTNDKGEIKPSYLACSNALYPIGADEIYDWYCGKCYKKILKRQGCKFEDDLQTDKDDYKLHFDPNESNGLLDIDDAEPEDDYEY